jgi:hypothetical protein
MMLSFDRTKMDETGEVSFSMQIHHVGEYNRDQWITFQAVREACNSMASAEKVKLRDTFQSYLSFRRELDSYHTTYLETFCRRFCFETGLSACCGFESIITFFADHVISFLLSTDEEMEAIFDVLQQPNRSGKCVYLGKTGCIWKVRPIACAMFVCGHLKAGCIENNPELQSLWTEFQSREKEYTWPTGPVIFDDLEKVFIGFGVKSPHMHFHQSPGLLRLKAEAGLITGKPRTLRAPS